MAIELMSPYWEALLRACHAKTQKQADRRLEELIARAQAENPSLNYAEAKAIQLSNIGWFWGEVSAETRARSMEFYPEASHPIFARNFNHSEDEILKAGIAMAKAMQSGKDLNFGIKVAQDSLGLC